MVKPAVTTIFSSEKFGCSVVNNICLKQSKHCVLRSELTKSYENFVNYLLLPMFASSDFAKNSPSPAICIKSNGFIN